MKCPNQVCHSGRVSTVNTYSHDHVIGIPAELKGLNITRRRKKCAACGEVFFTIELAEQEFTHLRRKTGRLEVAQASLRPGGGR